MKKIAMLIFLVLCNLSSKAQIIVTTEEVLKYMDTNKAFPKGAYLQDVNHVLDKFIGTWKGTYGGKNYEFRITKFLAVRESFKEDILLMRYLIANTNGTVIEDTRALPDSSPYVIRGDYLDTTTYALNYSGKNANCGQAGTIFIDFLKGSNNTKMTLFLVTESMIIDQNSCPNGGAKQIMPTADQMILLKQ